MKIAILSAVWKRHDIFKLFAKGIDKLKEEFPEIEFSVIIAGSEGRKSKMLVKYSGFTYIEIPNKPLAKKMQSTADYAKERIQPDYVFCLGSDDIIHPEAFKEYLKHANKGIDYIGCRDWFFYETKYGFSVYWGGYLEDYRKTELCGAGRMLSKRLMDKLHWKLWVGLDHILDTSMQQRLDKVEYTKHVIHLKELGLYCLDIKSDTNMTPFAYWDNTEDAIDMKKVFSYVWD